MFVPYIYIPGQWIPYRQAKSWQKNRGRYVRKQRARISCQSIFRRTFKQFK